MKSFRTLDDFEVSGKRVLVRTDLNVPFSEGEVSDTSRIEGVAPTLLELAENGARVIVLSHFGRPKGRAVPAMSLEPVTPHLSAALGGRDVAFTPAKRQTTARLPQPWRNWASSTSMTRFRQRTAPMPPPPAWRGCFPPPRAD